MDKHEQVVEYAKTGSSVILAILGIMVALAVFGHIIGLDVNPMVWVIAAISITVAAITKVNILLCLVVGFAAGGFFGLL